MNIDLKLKTYEQLQNEVMTLNTNSYLKDLKIDKLQSNWNSLREWLIKQREEYTPTDRYVDGTFDTIDETLDKMNELEEKDK